MNDHVENCDVTPNKTSVYSVGSRDTARCLEPLPSDPPVHLRRHRARILAAADTEPTRCAEKSRRERSHGERKAEACGAASSTCETKWTRITTKAVLSVGEGRDSLSVMLMRDAGEIVHVS